jgi:hypothetical protein
MNFMRLFNHFNLFPDQALCFWLGFLPAGIWVALLTIGVDDCLNALTCASHDSLAGVFVKTLFLYGIPAGLFAQLLGFFLRHFRPQSSLRWIWLSFLIPMCTLLLAGVQVEIVNMIECGTLKFDHDFDDTLIGISVYLGAALVSGLIAGLLIAVARLVQKIRQSHSRAVFPL